MSVSARLLVTGLLTFAALARAEPPIYRWTDARGSVHYTDNHESIPKDAQATTTQGDDILVMSFSQLPPPPRPLPPEGAEGGDSEAAWRQAFSQIHGQINGLEQEIAYRRASDDDVAGWPLAERAQQPAMHCGTWDGASPCLDLLFIPPRGDPEADRARVAQLKHELAQVQEQLDTLERQASWAGVPRAWRR